MVKYNAHQSDQAVGLSISPDNSIILMHDEITNAYNRLQCLDKFGDPDQVLAALEENLIKLQNMRV